MYVFKSDEDKIFKSLSTENGDQSASSLAKRLDRQALSKAQEGHLSEAETLFRQAVELFTAPSQAEPSGLAASLQHLSEVCFEQGKFIQSEDYIKKALAILEKEPAADQLELVESLKLYAKILRQKKFNYKAAQVEARARDILRKKREG